MCFVEKAGILKDNQKVHVPMLPAIIPALSPFDEECLKLAIEMDVDVVVVPSARNSVAVKEIKNALSTNINYI